LAWNTIYNLDSLSRTMQTNFYLVLAIVVLCLTAHTMGSPTPDAPKVMGTSTFCWEQRLARCLEECKYTRECNQKCFRAHCT
ncbi:hypothetical protein BKA69DRAFT_1047036, partial [Paraphysoderma sedebokerense]